MANGKTAFESMVIGMDMGTSEIDLSEKAVKERALKMQWPLELIKVTGLAPPVMTLSYHTHMKFANFPNLKAAIWAKSEHEFFKPLKVGGKAFVRGKVADKYIKRDRQYVVTEFETFDDTGEVCMRSRETGINVE